MDDEFEDQIREAIAAINAAKQPAKAEIAATLRRLADEVEQAEEDEEDDGEEEAPA